MNKSGIWPVEYKCLVKLFPKKEITPGGIHIPQETMEREWMAEEKGVFIAAGGNAFQDPVWSHDNRPKEGQAIIIDRYSGSLQKGKDGEMYRLLNDKEIGAILEAGDGE